jgi:hypothetical protein
MASRREQRDELKAALTTLQNEINEAKEERKAAKSQLEKAIEEGKPVSPFEKLYDGAVANLTGLQGKEKELLKRETLLSCSPSTKSRNDAGLGIVHALTVGNEMEVDLSQTSTNSSKSSVNIKNDGIDIDTIWNDQS